jgi:thiamine-phosphate pyrophosphorylase
VRLERSSIPPLYAITAPYGEVSVEELVRQLVAGGARWLQLRGKQASDAALFAEASSIAASLPPTVRFFVNDRVDIALAAAADGVHLGDSDLDPADARRVAGSRELVIGYSTHSAEEALRAAEREEIDYVAIGPIFESGTKNVRAPLGVEVIRQIRSRTTVPLVAIGGIGRSNFRQVLEAGADSCAVIGALYEGGTIVSNVRALLEAAERAG